MPRDKTESHEKIVAAALREFLKYGFKDASLRRLASAAGLSVSALYKHFPDKESMFASLVQPAYNDYVQLCRRNTARLNRALDESDLPGLWENFDRTVRITDCIYRHFDAFKLIICRSEGTRFESFLHQAAKLDEESTLLFIDELRERGVKLNNFSQKEFHLLTTAYIEAVFQTVRHDFTPDEARSYAKTLDTFFTLSWRNFFGF
ncbi:MAG: TetR/AcrR family transcriptional regulator [Firmicutes bacterium]|nr:TetR/AcrR family transcriptional regulator [Bacillota bacterium]